jgi:uncharacterized protein YndB with AHSA1/START domain
MRDIVLSRDLPYPRELVWQALTDSDELAAWLMPNDFRPVVGHAFTFRTDPAPGFDGTVHCRVLAIEPLERLEMSWRGGPLDTVLSYTLSDPPSGTRLLLRHSGFQGLGNLLPRVFLGSGWRKLLRSRLAAVLDRNAGQESRGHVRHP